LSTEYVRVQSCTECFRIQFSTECVRVQSCTECVRIQYTPIQDVSANIWSNPEFR
jgi:hypothetical protein